MVATGQENGQVKLKLIYSQGKSRKIILSNGKVKL